MMKDTLNRTSTSAKFVSLFFASSAVVLCLACGGGPSKEVTASSASEALTTIPTSAKTKAAGIESWDVAEHSDALVASGRNAAGAEVALFQTLHEGDVTTLVVDGAAFRVKADGTVVEDSVPPSASKKLHLFQDDADAFLKSHPETAYSCEFEAARADFSCALIYPACSVLAPETVGLSCIAAIGNCTLQAWALKACLGASGGGGSPGPKAPPEGAVDD